MPTQTRIPRPAYHDQLIPMTAIAASKAAASPAQKRETAQGGMQAARQLFET
jgi:hypothetical protein